MYIRKSLPLALLLLASSASQAGSTVFGAVSTDAQSEEMSQNQSGMLNDQSIEFGTVTGSTLFGKLDTTIRVDRVKQHQSGMLNEQSMRIGSIR